MHKFIQTNSFLPKSGDAPAIKNEENLSPNLEENTTDFSNNIDFSNSKYVKLLKTHQALLKDINHSNSNRFH